MKEYIPYSRKLLRVKTFANWLKLSISRIKLSRIVHCYQCYGMDQANPRMRTKPTRESYIWRGGVTKTRDGTGRMGVSGTTTPTDTGQPRALTRRRCVDASHVISCPIAKLCSCSEMETEQSAHGVLAIKKSLTVEEVMEYLTNADKFHCISVPPAKPKGNELYLYRADE